MKDALRKYIEENLVTEKKKKRFTFPLLSFSIKKIFTEECDEKLEDEIKIEPVKQKKKISSRSNVLDKIKNVLDDEEEIKVEQLKKETGELQKQSTIKTSDSIKYSLNVDTHFNEEEKINSEYLLEQECIQKREKKEMSQADISNFIEQAKYYSDFQTLLFKMIDDRNLKDSDVYNKVHIDRRLFSKIRNNKDYHPSKETVLLLAFALELKESEMEQLLDSASYSLPRNNHYDLIIRFCFINKIYNIRNVNDLLDEYNCELFSY